MQEELPPQSQRPASTGLPEVVVRETACKTILNRTSLGGYSLNCYTGCEHACVYCYARFMQRFHPHRERIAAARNINNSDFDFCEHQGRLIVNDSWGNQQGIEHLAEAIYEGTEERFLRDWFPER